MEIQELLSASRHITLSENACTAIKTVVDIAYDESKKGIHPIGMCLAAAFDLLVSSEYYKATSNRGWVYCNEGEPMLLYPFTNTCPRCIGNGRFKYAQGNKPESGQIGMIAVELLCQMLKNVFHKGNHNVEVYKASEPIDVIIYEPDKDKMIIAEVKAAPMMTLPLATLCEQQTELVDGEIVPAEHSLTDNPFYKDIPLFIFFPKCNGFEEEKIPLNINWNSSDPFLNAISDLVSESKSFFSYYVDYWTEAFNAYESKDRGNSIYWLTNGCGQPSPKPNDWPRRKGKTGYESISDAKTSVGMDRTDDIKKGIYQVLKLGADYKPIYGKEKIKTALISNIHAVRHYDEYLLTLRDIVWLVDSTRSASSIGEIDPDTPVYNLFDGILSFTQCDIRDNMIRELFDFE